MTLENKLGITDSLELARMEEQLSKKRAMELFEEGLLDTLEAGTFAALAAIHRFLFSDIYSFAGEKRNVNIAKGNFRFASIMYLDAALQNIEKMPQSTFEEIVEKYVEMNVAHPFREGNTRTVIVFAVLLAKHLGFEVNHELFREHSSYVRNALVWCTQGIYSKYEYLEKIFFDAILHERAGVDEETGDKDSKYEKIGDYKVRDYKERPHEYKK